MTVVENKDRVQAQEDASGFRVVFSQTGVGVFYGSEVVAAIPADKSALRNLQRRKDGLIAYLQASLMKSGFKSDGLPNMNYFHVISRFVESDKKKRRQKLERQFAKNKHAVRVDSAPPAVALYKARADKSEKAVDYLRRLYGDEIDAGTLTLSDLRKKDASLWQGLRNWANAGGHDLDAVIPRGKTTPGPAVQDLGFDPATLDPANPRDALTLQALRNREQTRERMRRQRAVLKP